MHISQQLAHALDIILGQAILSRDPLFLHTIGGNFVNLTRDGLICT